MYMKLLANDVDELMMINDSPLMTPAEHIKVLTSIVLF